MNSTFTNFDKYFEDRSEEAFDKIKKMEFTNYQELIKIYQESPKLLENFKKLKNPPNLPEINKNFKEYFNNNILEGYGFHSPIYYSTEKGLNSLRYASPELIDLIWINMKSSIVWYDQLIKDGYYIDKT